MSEKSAFSSYLKSNEVKSRLGKEVYANFINFTRFLCERSRLILEKKYLLVGLLNTIFSVTLFYILLQIFQNSQYQLILLMCFFVANLESHLTQRLLVWKSVSPYFSELVRFFAGAMGMFFINLVFLTILVDLLDYNTFASQVFLVLALPIFNYFSQKHAVFKSTKL